jgi:hypothetical protein
VVALVVAAIIVLPVFIGVELAARSFFEDIIIAYSIFFLTLERG